jgi:hypothetical protein
MADVSLDELFPYLAPYLPKAPDATMRLHLAAAAVEFLEATHILRQDLDPIPLVPAVAEYDLWAPYPVHSVPVLWVNNIRIQATTQRLISEPWTSAGVPRFYTHLPNAIVRLHPTPDDEYELTGLLVMTLCRDTTTAPDWIVEQWGDALVDGAIARVAAIPDKSWTDLVLTADRRARFDRAKALARIDDQRDIALRVYPRTF